MPKNPEVDSWFAEKKPASERTLQLVRQTILAAELRDLARRWCELMSAGSSARPSPRSKKK